VRRAAAIAIAFLAGLFGMLAGTAPVGATSSNPDQALEEQLSSLRYDPGPVDGTFDDDTAYAITAFQKVHGLPRSGEASPDVRAAIAAAAAAAQLPAPLASDGGANRVEIDLGRQVLFLYENDALLKILPVSTGSGEEFCDGGYCRNAVTETGSFAIYRQAQGWEHGPLGDLYNPQYFDGGIAIHGSTSVPPDPVSHGCVRIPMDAAEWFPNHVSIGTPVFVVAGAPADAVPSAKPPAAPAAVTR
jgi:hypothetical protein